MPAFEEHPLHPGEGAPLFIAAGVLKEPGQLEPFEAIEDPLAAPVLTLGGYSDPSWQGNARAGEQDFVYYPQPQAAGNARGFPNGGRVAIEALWKPVRRLSERGIKTIIQVTNLPHERPLDVVPGLAALAADVEPTAIEVNLSCPNGLDVGGKLEPTLSDNAEACGELITAVRAEVGWDVCLGIKDSPHATSPLDPLDTQAIRMLTSVLGEQVDFVTGINTIGGQPFPELTCAGGWGGMSGPIVAGIAKEHLRWQQYAPAVPYLSCGGVDSLNADREITERLRLGAMLVGGAQEFYRAKYPKLLAARWLQNYDPDAV